MDTTKADERVLRFLAKGPARVVDAAGSGTVLLDSGDDRGTIGAERKVLDRLQEAGFLVMADHVLALTASARERAGRHRDQALSDPQVLQEPTTILHDGQPQSVIVNAAESPLGLLWRRKDRNGVRFLDASELAAGERLRRDFTRGQFMPRLGVNWSAAGASGRQGGSGNGFAEMTDAALRARRRVEQALDAVGPELSGLLIDVCCFLKGLERVEAERGLPARSAKVLLKTALGVLSRHYQPPGRASASRTILHWGVADYRPRAG
jgi:hypothetical protein